MLGLRGMRTSRPRLSANPPARHPQASLRLSQRETSLSMFIYREKTILRVLYTEMTGFCVFYIENIQKNTVFEQGKLLEAAPLSLNRAWGAQGPMGAHGPPDGAPRGPSMGAPLFSFVFPFKGLTVSAAGQPLKACYTSWLYFGYHSMEALGSWLARNCFFVY